MKALKWMAHSVLLGAALVLGAQVAGAAELQALLEAAIAKNAEAAQSQQRVDKVSEETSDLLNEYRNTQKQIQSIRVYNEQLQKLTDSQQEEMTSLQSQIDNAVTIQREMTPFMVRMIDSLDQFVSLDVPFLIKERKERVAGLRQMMNRADVSESEKFRRVLEAYQIETDFGRTIEAYQANLDLDGGSRTVDFLRVGRVALVYITLDHRELGAWDQETRQWTKLDAGEFRDSVVQGLRVARKQTAPDLLRLPVPAPQEASK